MSRYSDLQIAIRERDLIHEAKTEEYNDHLVRLLMRDYKYQKPIK